MFFLFQTLRGSGSTFVHASQENIFNICYIKVCFHEEQLNIYIYIFTHSRVVDSFAHVKQGWL